jgi:hypothetical protein
MPCLELMLGVAVLLCYSQWQRFKQAIHRALSFVSNQEIRQGITLPASVNRSLVASCRSLRENHIKKPKAWGCQL